MNTKVFALLALILLTGIFHQLLKNPTHVSSEQMQQEEAIDLFDVYYQAINIDDEKIIDLLWLQQAAKIIEEAGGNYFNIIEQSTGTKVIDNKELSYMEGIVEMTDDIQAEYNASEINSIAIEELE